MPTRSLSDLAYAWFTQQLSSGIVNGTSDPVAGSGSTGSYGNTQSAVGVQVAPAAANTTIVQIASGSLPAGLYDIKVIAGYGATAESVTDFNQVLRAGNTVIGSLLVSGANLRNEYSFKYTLDGSTALRVTTNTAGGSAGSVYLAAIYATKMG